MTLDVQSSCLALEGHANPQKEALPISKGIFLRRKRPSEVEREVEVSQCSKQRGLKQPSPGLGSFSTAAEGSTNL